MNFIPQQPSQPVSSVPFYDDVTHKDGWQGQATTKSIPTLQDEIIKSMSHLGGHVLRFQRGKFEFGAQPVREGFRIHYIVESTIGLSVPGRIDVVALPIRKVWEFRRTEIKRQDASLRMALYMLRVSLDGIWFLQVLSPGYAPLLPWMLASGDKTVSQLWAESPVMNNLLPPGSSSFEGEILEGEIVGD